MARTTSGTNENLRNNNGISNIDVNAFTMFGKVWVDSGATGTVYMTASAISSGNSAANFNIKSGQIFRFNYRWSTTQGNWDDSAGGLSTGVWHAIAVAYDRSLTTNDPTVYIDGTKKTVGSGLTEATTPAGTAKAGIDSVTMGENVGGGEDFAGRHAERAFWSRILSDDEMYALTAGDYSPDHFNNGLEAYWPIRGNSSPEPELVQGADLTLTGTSKSSHPRMLYMPKRQFFIPVSGGTTISLAGTIAGASTITAAMNALYNLTGTVVGASTISADANITYDLSGTVAGQSTATADMSLTLIFSGTIVGQSTATGTLTLAGVPIELSGTLVAVSTINGTLTVVPPPSWSEESDIGGSWTPEAAASGSWTEESEVSDSWTEETPIPRSS